MASKLNAYALSLVLIFSSLFSAVAQAGMVSAADAQHQYNKAELISALETHEVQEQLGSLGVDIDLVKDRVQNLTPAELAQVNQQMENMPAGSGVLGVLLIIFIVFVVTDLLGATNIFPFINPVN